MSTTSDPINPITGEGEMQKQLECEIREMISALTRRLADLQNIKKHPRGSSSDHNENDHHEGDHGARIITMAGSNVGATMRSELDMMEKLPSPSDQQDLHHGGEEHEEQVPLTTYLNSNFQSINNSIMLGGSYSTNDPGIHLDVSDYYDPEENRAGAAKHKQHGKKREKKEITEPSSD